jgi:hypothetical protein
LAASFLLPPASNSREPLQAAGFCLMIARTIAINMRRSAILNLSQVCAGASLRVRVTWVVDRFSFAIIEQA